MSSKHKMSVLPAQMIIFASLIASAAAKVPMAMPNCPKTCGDFDIDYPFGIGHPTCYLNPWFEITCNNNTIRPFLRKFNLEVLGFSFSNRQNPDNFVVVNNPVYSTCRDGCSWNSTDLRGGPYIFSSLNTFLTVGCENTLMMNRKKKVLAGCTSTCTSETPNSNGCYGINCCQTSIPSHLDFYRLTSAVNKSACTYSFLASNGWFQTNFSYNPFVIKSRAHVPVALTWGVHSRDFPGGSAYTSSPHRFTTLTTKFNRLNCR